MTFSIDKPSSNGETLLMSAVTNGNVEMVALLLRKGADPHITVGGAGVLECAAQLSDSVVREEMMALLKSYMWPKSSKP